MKLNKKWYSVIISLLLVWFMLILSTGIFRLILNEMKSNRAMWDYMKSTAWAEAAQELALLDIKIHWYWYVWSIENTVNSKSVMLSSNNLDYGNYKKNTDVLISYSNDGKVNWYDGSLSPLWYDIIPLFYIDDDWEHKVTDVVFKIKEWDSSLLSWNIVWDISWISWYWENLTWVEKTLGADWFSYNQKWIWNFLTSSSTNYLVLFNSWKSNNLNYTLDSVDPLEFFTKPSLDIISTWELSDYKQNIKTNINNTEFLNILKYSIYSN